MKSLGGGNISLTHFAASRPISLTARIGEFVDGPVRPFRRQSELVRKKLQVRIARLIGLLALEAPAICKCPLMLFTRQLGKSIALHQSPLVMQGRSERNPQDDLDAYQAQFRGTAFGITRNIL